MFNENTIVDLFEQLNPAYVAPLVVWLCHESCPANGGAFEAAGGYVGKYRWQRSLGKAFIPPDLMTPESVRDSWEEITNMDNATSPTTIQGIYNIFNKAYIVKFCVLFLEHMTALVTALTGEGKPQIESSQDADIDKGVHHYTHDDLILYSLGGT